VPSIMSLGKLLLPLCSLALLLGAAQPHKRYDGHRVVSITCSDDRTSFVIRDLVEELQLDVWATHHLQNPVMDILLPPQQYDSFMGHMKKNGIKVQIFVEDVQRLIDAQHYDTPTTNIEIGSDIFNHTAYHTLDEIYASLDALEADSSYVTTYVAGTTLEGRDIRVAKISMDGSDTRPVIWVDCGIHAREWISQATCQWMLDHLVSDYGTDDMVTAVMGAYDFHIMPSANPDGYVFNWEHDRIWRKNRHPFDDILNCHGVDANRNFDIHFGEVGASTAHCMPDFEGEFAFSEKESQAIRDALTPLANRLTAYFTIHSYSELWMTPYGFTSDKPSNWPEQMRVAEYGVNYLKAVNGIEYQFGNIHDIIYAVSGGSSDWAYEVLGVPYSYALELRPKMGNPYTFMLPPSYIIPVGNETMTGILGSIIYMF
ncbi:unnamed protein product, partial [Meganyctiphanes norvegica]